MFTHIKQHGLSLYSFPRSLFDSDAAKRLLLPRNLIRSLAPTFIFIVLVDLVSLYTSSGYSVMVIMLLSAVLYTAYRSGALLGVLSAFAIITYNFYLVATMRNLPLLSYSTLESGALIAIVFPGLALLIGTLKERNDALLLQEQHARVKAEDSARQLRFMAESMPQKIFTAKPNGKSTYMNPQWIEYTGSTSYPTWFSLLHPQDYKENMEHWRRSLETGEPFQFEHRLKRQDGKYIWHLTRATALRGKNGKIRLWVGSSTDIEGVKKTKKLEADTARLIRQRSQLLKLNSAKDEFISIASHQLRTPATSVKQYLNMVLDGYGGVIPTQVRGLLLTADDSNERQLSVINDLLQVAQVDAGKVVLHKISVDVNKMLTSILRDYKSTFDKRNQKVKFERKRQKVFVTADPTKLRMAVENVIDNASKYSLPQSTVTISLATGREVHIIIKDEGVGMNKADITRIFDKFMRLDNPLSTSVGGNGLGLYWVKKIIELHGGEISATSAVAKGSTFTIKLPATKK